MTNIMSTPSITTENRMLLFLLVKITFNPFIVSNHSKADCVKMQKNHSFISHIVVKSNESKIVLGTKKVHFLISCCISHNFIFVYTTKNYITQQIHKIRYKPMRLGSKWPDNISTNNCKKSISYSNRGKSHGIKSTQLSISDNYRITDGRKSIFEKRSFSSTYI